MMVQGKVWGLNRPIFKNHNVEVHYLNVKKGGFCSEHKHQHKFNQFVVIKGQIKIIVCKNYEGYSLDETIILNPGDETIISPGDYHKFEALTDTDLLEIYWVELQADDIFRRTVGGVK